MGDYSTVCEQRGRALPGKGCTNRVRFPNALRFCALAHNRGRCQAVDVDTLNFDGTIDTPVGAVVLNMVQLQDLRVFQRTTTTGGANGKGVGNVDVPVVISGGPTDVEYRLRDASNNATLQDWSTAQTQVPVGSQSVRCSVPARLGWYFVDLRAKGTPDIRLGTARIGMGRNTLLWGQSQAARLFMKIPAYPQTMASSGVAIDANTSVYAKYSEGGRTVTSPTWANPADASAYDSTFTGEYLRRQAAAFGVNCGLIGHAVGNTVVANWQPGTQNNSDLRDVLNNVGGFEAAYLYIGGSDAGAGTTGSAYMTAVSAMFNDAATYNAARGSAFEKYITAMGTRLAGGSGTPAKVTELRNAAKSWAAANGGQYLEPHNINLEDDIHQGQPGSITIARDLHRATQNTNTGPTLVSGTRAGAAISLTASAALSLSGDVANRFQAYAKGTTTSPLAIASAAVNNTTITVTLGADPGNTAEIDVYWLRHADPSGTTAAANMIYDTYNADGLGGRQLQPSLLAPVQVPAVGGTPAPSPTPTAAFRDTFTDTSGTALASHVPETGQAWTTPTGAMSISSAGTLIASTAPSNGLNAYDPGAVPAWAEAKMVYNGTANNSCFIIMRAADVNNMLVFGIEAGNAYTIGRFVLGTFGRIQQQTGVTFVNGQTYTIRAEVDGQNLRLYVDGTLVLSGTDNMLGQSGKIGCRISATTNTATTGTAMTELTAGTL